MVSVCVCGGGGGGGSGVFCCLPWVRRKTVPRSAFPDMLSRPPWCTQRPTHPSTAGVFSGCTGSVGDQLSSLVSPMLSSCFVSGQKYRYSTTRCSAECACSRRGVFWFDCVLFFLYCLFFAVELTSTVLRTSHCAHATTLFHSSDDGRTHGTGWRSTVRN